MLGRWAIPAVRRRAVAAVLRPAWPRRREPTPDYVADLGCGPGNLTAVLARRWPEAEVVGVDNSAEMITAATESAAPAASLSFVLGDVRDWQPRARRRTCSSATRSCNGCLAITTCWCAGPACSHRAAGSPSSFPATSTQPSHAIVAGDGRLAALARPARGRASSTVRRAIRRSTRSCSPGPVTRWTPGRPATCTSCPGENPVLEWTKGTTLRPVLAALGRGAGRGVPRRVRRTVAQVYNQPVRSVQCSRSAGCSRWCTVSRT